MKNILLIILIVSSYSLSYGQKKQPTNKALNSRSDTVDILNYEINLDMTNVGNQLINGNCKVKFTPKINNTSILKLDLEGLTVDSITLLGTPIVFNHASPLITITLPTALNTSDTAEVTVYYNGSPIQDASGWGGFYFSSGYTFNLGVGFQGNPHNYGRIWFPCFDNFVERSTYEFNIITGGGNKAHCNGLLMSESIITGDTITRKWVMNEEIPTYLACVAVSDYETAKTTFNGINNIIPVELVAQAADTTNMKNSFLNLHGAFDAYEQSYGPYLWSKIGFSAVPFGSGAMEHATNIAYPTSSIDGTLQSETLMAHEFAHHWWGDLVTCETAEDMWINEGMAVYSEHLFLENIYDYTTSLNAIKTNHKEVVRFAHINEGGYRAISGIPHQYTYGDHVYKKGAVVAHNMRAYLGDSLFFVGLQSVINTYQFKSINSIQFRDELTSATGINMTNFFKDWVFAPGFSHFDIDSTVATPNGPNFDIDIQIKQKLRGATVLHTNTPLEVTFYDNNWNKHQDTITVSGLNSLISVSVPFNPTVVILNEGNRLNQARTDNTLIINTPATYSTNDMDLSMVRSLTVNAVTDSAMIQIEHHWVAPDSIKNNSNNYNISTSRYWSIDGILPNGFQAKLELNFDGRTSAGYLDTDIIPLNADSVILLYRESPKSDWSEYRNYTKFNIIPNLPLGWMTLDTILLGEYTFATGKSTVGITESFQQETQFNVFPNPSDSFIWIQPKVKKGIKDFDLVVFSTDGKLIYSDTFDKKKKIDSSNWKAGIYVITISNNKTLLESHQIIVK